MTNKREDIIVLPVSELKKEITRAYYNGARDEQKSILTTLQHEISLKDLSKINNAKDIHINAKNYTDKRDLDSILEKSFPSFDE